MKINRDEVFKLLCQCRMHFNSKEQIYDLIETSSDDEKNIEEKVLCAIRNLYKGTTNGYLSEVYEAITGESVKVVGRVHKLFQCPCCNRFTLTERYNSEKGTGYDICGYCNWEDDGTIDPDTTSSVNRGTISEYRSRIQSNPDFYYKEKWLS